MEITPTASATAQPQPSASKVAATTASVTRDSPRLCSINQGWRSSQGKETWEAASNKLAPTATSSSKAVLPCNGQGRSPNPTQPATRPTRV